jgi:broad specificity phosphatase PhoE
VGPCALARYDPGEQVAATLILLRHAAHVQLDRVLSGRTPGVPLSDAGRLQAARFAERLAGEGLTAIHASPLDRTQETAAAIARATGLPVETVPALVELDFGDWTGTPLDALGGAEWDRWNHERDTARPPNGESMAEAQARIVAHLERAASSGGTVALVTHADMIRAAVCHVLGLPLQAYWRFDVSPASMTTLVWEHWGGRLISLNVTHSSPRA